MHTSIIVDVEGTAHLPSYEVLLEEMSGALVGFRVHAQEAAHARTRVESDASQYGVRIRQILRVESPTP